MRADRVEVSWDNEKSDWVVRIESGSEVIRRHYKASKDADEKTLRAKADEAVKDEGYEVMAAAVNIRR
jgi:Na+-transporting methylmalonyl-CoA/oxaloacetate decarboxylase gamma subunit